MSRLHPKALTRSPQGQPTRGKTARNRLRRVDNFVMQYDPTLLRREDGLFRGAYFVDLGYGAEPFTTLESAERFRRLNPQLPVLGVEIDPPRVAAALPYADDLTHFRFGGFNVPLRQRADGAAETVRLIRAFNVLRQYDESEVPAAWSMLVASLLPGGLLVEGTSEPFGRLWVANLLRKPLKSSQKGEAEMEGQDALPVQHEGLVFSTNFRLGFDPADFQAVLPKNLIHRVVPGEPISDFFEAWKRATRETAPMRVWGLRKWFMASAERLLLDGYDLLMQRKLLSRGYLLWRFGSQWKSPIWANSRGNCEKNLVQDKSRDNTSGVSCHGSRFVVGMVSRP